MALNCIVAAEKKILLKMIPTKIKQRMLKRKKGMNYVGNLTYKSLMKKEKD